VFFKKSFLILLSKVKNTYICCIKKNNW